MRIPTLSGCLVAHAALFAQFGIMPKAGLTIAHFTDNTITSDSKIGLVVGVAADFGGEHVMHFQPEILYVQKGYTENASVLGYSFESRVTLDYVEVPLMAKVVIGRTRERLLLEAGPYAAFALGMKIAVEGQGPLGPPVSGSDHLSPDEAGLEPLDFGLNVGAGIAVPLKSGTLQCEARYQFGLTDVIEDDGLEGYNRGVVLTLGYLFSMGGAPALPPAKGQ